MLTPDQEKWVNHLSTTNRVEIFPYDSECNDKFEKIKAQIQSTVGTEFGVFHRGASSLGISGQKEIDVYIPISKEKIEEIVLKMQLIFGKPSSVYPLEQTKFLANIDGTKIEIMLIDKKHERWIKSEIFYNLLKENPEVLEQYRKLKEECAGLNCQQYYLKKIEFINGILSMS